MDLLAILAVVFFLATPIMAIVTLASIKQLQRDIDDIKLSLLKLAVGGKKNADCEGERAPSRTENATTATRPVPPAAFQQKPIVVKPAKPVEPPAKPIEPQAKPIESPVKPIEPPAKPVEPPVKPVESTAMPKYNAEPTAMDLFWTKIEDWFCVRGEFAPKGMTREFAVATRWLTRIGSILLVGAIAYFLMLAIDKGWIGPRQRVFGMMFWGGVGATYGTWLKLKSERYAILGEVCAAIGLVAMYLSFGLGHRYFNPPVIASGYAAFAGLFAATLAAGFLSVRLKSLTIASLALVGGFLVPTICSFTNHDVQLHIYLFLLSLGSCAVVYFRSWTLYAFAAIAVSLGFSQVKCGSCANCDVAVSYMFHALEFALTIAATVWASMREDNSKIRPFYWIPVVLAGIFCLCKMGMIIDDHYAWRGALALNHFGWAVVLSALAFPSRRRAWGGTPVFIVFSCVCAAFALGTACIDWWHINDATVALLFCLFAALLVELGARSGERSLQILSLIATMVMSFVGYILFTTAVGQGGGGYAHDLTDRIQYLWPIPALVAFVGWRLGGDGFWREWLRLRPCAYGIASAMAFVIITAESHFFGKEHLPALRGGFVTIVWALIASTLLAVGIVRRIRVSRLVGLGILALSVVKLLLFDTASLATPGRVGVFAAVGALLIVGAFLYLKFKARFESVMSPQADASQLESLAGPTSDRI